MNTFPLKKAEEDVRKAVDWICSECEKKHPDKHLFCGTIHDPLRQCTGKHPDYWDKTKHWPVRNKPLTFYVV